MQHFVDAPVRLVRQGPLPLPAPVSVIGEEALTSASPSLASALKLSFQPPPRGGVGPVELHYLSLLAQGPATALGLLDGGLTFAWYNLDVAETPSCIGPQVKGALHGSALRQVIDLQFSSS